jgi:murein L,D-transpeptidase YcbB/YkuD
VGDEHVHASAQLPAFYERRAFRAAWSGPSGPGPRVHALVRALRAAEREGLRPRDYHLERIEATLARLEATGSREPHRLSDLDLLATDAFLVYGAHLAGGRVNPETIDPEWWSTRGEADLVGALERVVEGGDVEAALAGLAPPQPGYARLREALSRYRALAEGREWGAVPGGPTLRRGDRDPRVVALRARLAATGEIVATPPAEAELFDESLEEALRGFQRRHGLDADGALGARTQAALDVPARERARQIAANLERWRWLPRDLGARHVRVNVAAFELDVVEGGARVLGMRVVVGRPYRRTPVFSDRIRYLVFSPYWHVPPGIAARDVLPAVRKDVGYLEKRAIRVLEGWGADAREVDPRTIDWSGITPATLRFRFRQDPGPDNQLGRVKFMFPNEFDVYLHDTPARRLFERSERDFSSGCIRVEKPVELAEFLLRGSDWTRERILAAMARGVEQTVRLPEPVPVHLVYWTAFAGADGVVQFRADVYGRDAPLVDALDREPRPERSHR